MARGWTSASAGRWLESVMAGEWQPYQPGGLLEIKHGFAFEGRFFSDEPIGPILVTPSNFRIGGGFSSETKCNSSTPSRAEPGHASHAGSFVGRRAPGPAR